MRILRLSIIIWRNVSHISLWTEFPARRTMSSAPYLPWTEFPACSTMSSAPYFPLNRIPNPLNHVQRPIYPFNRIPNTRNFLGWLTLPVDLRFIPRIFVNLERQEEVLERTLSSAICALIQHQILFQERAQQLSDRGLPLVALVLLIVA